MSRHKHAFCFRARSAPAIDCGQCFLFRGKALFWKPASRLVCGALALVLAAPAYPQAASQDSQAGREEIRRRQQQEQAEQRERLDQPRVSLHPDDADAATPRDTTAIPESPEGFLIERVIIDTGASGAAGSTRRRFPWLAPIASRYEGKRLGVAGIEHALKSLTQAFIKRGYVTTRVLLPEQDIAGTRTLRLVVVQGLVGLISVSPVAPAADAGGQSAGGPGGFWQSIRQWKHGGTWRNAFPAGRGKLLNIRDLEQGLEQMKRVPSQNVTMDLRPGANPGESDVVISRKNALPIRGSLGIDNSGDKNTGRWQANATGSWDNPLFLNDVFSFTCNGAVANSAGQNTRGNNFSYAVPFWYWTAFASYNSYSYRQTVQGFYSPYESSGNSRCLEARLLWLARRDQNTKLSFQARLTRRGNRNYIDGVELEVQRRDTTALELAVLFQRNSRGAMLDAGIAWRCGLPWFHADTDPANHPADSPTLKYRVFTADMTVRAGFTIASVVFNYQASLRAQITGDRLYGSEYFSIGSRYTVRGFDERQTLGAEKGATLRNELAWPVLKTRHSLYLALDGGFVAGPAGHYNPGSTLAGGALGLRGGWKRFYYDATIGCPLYKPAGLHTTRTTCTVQAGVQF